MSIARKPAHKIAEEWYDVDGIERAIARQRLPATFANSGGGTKVPENIYSREFAEWLTDQYRLAMAKGIQLGREGSES